MWVPNPVQPAENFADRWREAPGKEQEFWWWLQKARDDFGTLLVAKGLDETTDRLIENFGTPAADAAVRLGTDLRTAREGSALAMAAGTGTLTTGSGVPVRRHNF